MNLLSGISFTSPTAHTIGVYIAAGLTICIYSFLYKDNPLYKIAEHIYVGLSTGYLLAIMWFDAITPFLINPLKEGKYGVIIPGLLGLLLFTRFFPKYAWISRFTLAFIIGAAAGISAPNQVHGYLLRHCQATIEVFNGLKTVSFWQVIDNIIILAGVISVLIYFFFSVAYNRVIKGISYLGIVFLMVFFGAAFGYTVMGRISLLIGRVRFLLIDWLGLCK